MTRFAEGVADWAVRAAGRVDGVVRGTARRLLDEAAAATPVRSGRARDGWRLEEGDGAARIVNDVPYAAALEGEAGMVRGAVAAWPDIVAEAAEEARRS